MHYAWHSLSRLSTFLTKCVAIIIQFFDKTSSSAIAERPHELGDFEGVGQYEAEFYVEELRFAPISMDR